MATVKLFGAFGDMAGWAEREIEPTTLSALKALIATENPRLAGRLDHPSTLVILNATIIPSGQRFADVPISASDEIAFGPPVSGG